MYKVGDKVRCVRGNEGVEGMGLVEGKVYTVENITDGILGVELMLAETGSWVAALRFEPGSEEHGVVANFLF